MFPVTRLRRLRAEPMLRELTAETRLSVNDLIWPVFVKHGMHQRTAIPSMPGQFQLSVDELIREADRAWSAGLKAVLLFGLPKKKDLAAREAIAADGIIQKAIAAVRKNFPEMVVMADLCFCEYMSHGHCGVLKKNRNGRVDVDNDATLDLLRKAAVAQARAGAHVVAPSGMMDGAVAVIRDALDSSGFQNVAILSYAAKFASCFYGPFRDAAGSTPSSGNRRGYQMDPANGREALREMAMDVVEGADMLMVKPALAYLDVLAAARREFNLPLVAYNVSGEYAMVKAAEEKGWLAGWPASLEILTAIKRAGADLIITYHALEVAESLRS